MTDTVINTSVKEILCLYIGQVATYSLQLSVGLLVTYDCKVGIQFSE
jgi:hypothetical protein